MHRRNYVPFPSPFVLHQCFTHSLPYSFFHLLWNLTRKSGKDSHSAQRKNGNQLQNLDGTKYTALTSKFEGTRPTGRIGWLRLRHDGAFILTQSNDAASVARSKVVFILVYLQRESGIFLHPWGFRQPPSWKSKIAIYRVDAERVSRAYRPSAILDFWN